MADTVGAEVRDALIRGVGTRTRRWLVAVTLLLGTLGAAGIAVEDPSFAAVSVTAHSLISLTLPFLGVLSTHDLLEDNGSGRTRTAGLLPTLAAAVIQALAVAIAGVLIVTVVVAAAGGTWAHAGLIALGSLLVQVVARFVGAGLGLLIRPVWVACLATVLLPLGLYWLLSAIEALGSAQPWLAPYVTVRTLLSGEMTALAWAQWVTVALLWGAGLTALGAARLRKQDARVA